MEVKTTTEAPVDSSKSVAASEDSHLVTINVENFLPEDTPTYYSDGMVVVHSANEFVVSFLQTVYPLVASKEELAAVKSLKRNCIVRIIMSPAQFEQTANALVQNFQKYQESYKKL